MITLTLTDREQAKVHKALCLLAEREHKEAAADPQIDALFSDAARDRAATAALASKVYQAKTAAADLLTEAQALVQRLRGMAVHPSHYEGMERAITRATQEA